MHAGWVEVVLASLHHLLAKKKISPLDSHAANCLDHNHTPLQDQGELRHYGVALTMQVLGYGYG